MECTDQLIGPLSPGFPGKLLGEEFEIALLVGGDEDPLADDRVFRPVEHEDRRAGRNVREALVDDQRTRIFRQADRIEICRRDLLVLLHQFSPLVVVATGDEFVDDIHEFLLEGHQIDRPVRSRPVMPARTWTGRSKLGRILHDRSQFLVVAADQPVEAAGILRCVTLRAIDGVEHHLEAKFFHLADQAFARCCDRCRSRN